MNIKIQLICVISALVMAAMPLCVRADNPKEERESLFPEGSRKLGVLSHFSWGADVGTSIDMSSEDMSSVDADVNLGYKGGIISFAGAGSGVHRSFGQGHIFIPVYGLFRTSFRNKPSLLFWEIRAGYSFNTVSHEHAQSGAFASTGIGINLARSSGFSSHIVLAYGYFGLEPYEHEGVKSDRKSINYAQLRIGISF